jgi:hypothetical protein
MIINRVHIERIHSKFRMVKTISVDIVKIDLVLSEISKLIIRLNKKPKKDVRLINTITKIRNQIQDAVMDAKLKKSLQQV